MSIVFLRNLLPKNFCEYALFGLPRRSGIATLANFSDAPLPPVSYAGKENHRSRFVDFCTRALLPIGWMVRIDGPAIGTDGRVIAPPFDALLPA